MKDQIILIQIDDPVIWNAHFSHCLETDLQQTWEYGQSVQDCVDWQPVRQLIQIDGRPVALAQTLVKDVPLLGSVARVQHGPLFLRENGVFNPERAVAALKTFKAYWIEEQQSNLYLTPAILPGILPAGWPEACGLTPSGEVLWASVRVDLTQDAEEIRKKLHRKWRKALRRAEEAGLEILISQSQPDFDFFLEKYADATREKGIAWPSVELARQMWVHAHSQMQIFTVLKNQVKIAETLMVAYAKTAFSFVGWNGPLAPEFHASNFLIWQAMLHYQRRNYKWYDAGGIDPENLPGITTFKRHLKGEEYHFAGNFEARPAGSLEQMVQTDYRSGLGHILRGLELPKGEAPDVAGKVLVILSEFIRQATGCDCEIDDDLSLINGGLIDSLSLVSVIQSLQDVFNIDIGVTEITIDNFDTLQSISHLIKSKLDY